MKEDHRDPIVWTRCRSLRGGDGFVLERDDHIDLLQNERHGLPLDVILVEITPDQVNSWTLDTPLLGKALHELVLRAIHPSQLSQAGDERAQGRRKWSVPTCIRPTCGTGAAVGPVPIAGEQAPSRLARTMLPISASGDRQAFIEFLPLPAARGPRRYSNGHGLSSLGAVEPDGSAAPRRSLSVATTLRRGSCQGSVRRCATGPRRGQVS